MKIHRLYLKYFIAVMGIIIVLQVMIAVLFRVVSNQWFHRETAAYIDAAAYALQESVSDKIEADRRNAAQEYPRLNEFIGRLTTSLDANIWVYDEGGRMLASNVRRDKPDFPIDMEQRGAFLFAGPRHGRPGVYVVVPFKTTRGVGAIYSVRIHQKPPVTDLWFAVGLVLATSVVALALFPLTRFITVPLKRLTASADAIASGNFDLRVDERSTDEIGDLARAFNRMSDRVRQMIRGTKELTANVSHQIRSPLARMSVTTGILSDHLERGDVNGVRKGIVSMEREINEIDRLTGRIIELIRAETSHGRAEYSLIDLSAAAADASVRFGETLQRNGIQCTFNFDEHLPQISALKDECAALFDILYDNAVKYTPSGGSLILRTYVNGLRIFIEMSNSSDGSDFDNDSTLFEPFSRRTFEKIPGYGLGLAIAYRIIENHGGEINAALKDGMFTVRCSFPVG